MIINAKDAHLLIEGYQPVIPNKARNKEPHERMIDALRDCWCTPRWVLEIYRELIGPIDTDPFFNPWSHTAEFMNQDEGCFVYMGDTPEEDGTKADWIGNTFVNGNYSRPRPWVERCAKDGKHKNVGALVPAHFAGWWDSLWEADGIVWLGRVPFDAPPGIKASTPNGGSALALWKPAGDPLSPFPRRWVITDEHGESHKVTYTPTLGGVEEMEELIRKAECA